MQYCQERVDEVGTVCAEPVAAGHDVCVLHREHCDECGLHGCDGECTWGDEPEEGEGD